MNVFKTALILGLAISALKGYSQNTDCKDCDKQKAKNEQANDSCNFNNFTVEGATITINDEKNVIAALVSFGISDKKGTASKAFAMLKMENCKGEIQYVKVELTLDSKTNLWVGKQNIDQNPDCQWTALTYTITILNSCEEEYESDELDVVNPKSLTKQERRVKIHKRTRKSADAAKDSCDFKQYTIEEQEITIYNDKAVLSILFTANLSEKNGLANNAYLLIKIENCKGEIQYVKVALIFDSKSNLWIGKQSIVQNPECPWSILAYEMSAYNACNEKYTSDIFELEEINDGLKDNRRKTKKSKKARMPKDVEKVLF